MTHHFSLPPDALARLQMLRQMHETVAARKAIRPLKDRNMTHDEGNPCDEFIQRTCLTTRAVV